MTRSGAVEVAGVRAGATPYFALALGWSWLLWSLHAVFGHGAEPARSWLFLLGGAGPLLAAVLLTHVREDAATRRSFWARAFDPRRIRGRWWAAALLLHPALVGLAFATDAALGGAAFAARTLPASLASLLALAFFVFWFGPLPEEIGWRGFALDRLAQRLGEPGASLLLGAVWALWHVPLFFVPGTFQAELGLGSLRSVVFLASMVPLSVLIGWVYAEAGRSTLAAALVHFSGNLCGELLPKTTRVATLELVLLALAAIAVCRAWPPAQTTPGGDAR